MVPLDGPFCSCHLIPSNLMGTHVARKFTRHRLAQVKVRLPELLRRELEREAARNEHSMNAEIVKRLHESFRVLDQTMLIANAVLTGLDDAVVEKIEDILKQRLRDDYFANMDEL
jgi:Arc-like DNA binding domain